MKKEKDSLAIKYFSPGSIYSAKIFNDKDLDINKSSLEGNFFYVHLIILDDTTCAVMESSKNLKKSQRFIDKGKAEQVYPNMFSYVATENRIEIGSWCTSLGWTQIYLGKVNEPYVLTFGNVKGSKISGSNDVCRRSNLVINYPNKLDFIQAVP